MVAFINFSYTGDQLAIVCRNKPVKIRNLEEGTDLHISDNH